MLHVHKIASTFFCTMLAVLGDIPLSSALLSAVLHFATGDKESLGIERLAKATLSLELAFDPCHQGGGVVGGGLTLEGLGELLLPRPTAGGMYTAAGIMSSGLREGLGGPALNERPGIVGSFE